MIVFQLVFGALVFGLTRAYYLREPAPRPPPAAPATAQAVHTDDGQFTVPPEIVASLTTIDATDSDPDMLHHLAEQYFASKDYEQAATYYDRLLAFDPDNADVRNNLALTLQYTGRTTEALANLTENVSRHPDHQRSWLTLGYVNAQAGNVDAAREALTTAVGLDPASDVGASAQRMLDGL